MKTWKNPNIYIWESNNLCFVVGVEFLLSLNVGDFTAFNKKKGQDLSWAGRIATRLEYNAPHLQKSLPSRLSW